MIFIITWDFLSRIVDFFRVPELQIRTVYVFTSYLSKFLSIYTSLPCYVIENVINLNLCFCWSGEKDAQDKRKLTSKWRPTTKGTLKRTYRVRSTEEGRRILKEIASVLSEDDHFVDASTHKVNSFLWVEHMLSFYCTSFWDTKTPVKREVSNMFLLCIFGCS